MNRLSKKPVRPKREMKKPATNPLETKCPECMGTGFAVVRRPARPSVRIYQVCKECKGKGRIAAD
jgi:DnaJ-class molecular chaperone